MIPIASVYLCLLVCFVSSSTTTEGPKLRIVGGSEAAPGEFPGIVRLITEKDGIYCLCGGTIIDLEHIITAAHCTDGIKTNKVLNIRLFYDNIVNAFTH